MSVLTRACWLATIAAASWNVHSSWGQTPEAIGESRSHRVRYTLPYGGYWPGDAAGGAVAIYSLIDPSGEETTRPSRVWIARKVQELPTGFEVMWAEGRTCPQLLGVIAWMTELQPPSVEFPGTRDWLPPGVFGAPLAPPPGPDTRSRSYTVWGRGWDANRAPVEVTFSGSTQIMTGFGEAAVERMAPCWTAEAPTIASAPVPDIADQGQRRRSPDEDFPDQPPGDDDR